MSCLSPATFDHVPLAIAHLALDGQILRANSAFAEMVGTPERDLINTPASSLFDAEPTPDEARALRSVVRGEVAEAELRKELRRADGSLTPVEIRYSALRDLGGRARCGMIMLAPPPDAAARDELEKIAKVVSGETGEPFFRSLLLELTEALGAEFAFIAELVESPVRSARTLAACDRGHIIPNFEYALEGTPCDALLQYGTCSFPAGVGRMFPGDATLQALGVEAYVGASLQSSRRRPFGMIVMMHRQPLANGERVQTLVRTFAPRVAAELERLQTEQELRKSEKYLSEAQRIGRIGNWVWEPREDRIHGSEETYRICGIGGPPRAVPSSEFFALIHPEDRERVRDAFARAVREVAPLEMEFRVGAAEGAARIVELRGELAFTLDRRSGRMRGTLQDVTDRELATEELRKLSMAVEQAGDQIVITDAGGTIEYVNRAFEKMTGYSRQEAIGRNPRILKSGLQSPAFYRDLWATLTRGEVFRGVFINRKKNGEIYYEEKTLTPVRNPKGEITKYVASGTDITERRLAEEEQARLQDALKVAATEWRITFDSMQSAIMMLDAEGAIRRVNHAASNSLRARPGDLVGQRLEQLAHHEPWITASSLVEALREHGTIPPLEIRDAKAGVSWEVALTFAGAQGGNQVLIVVRDTTRTVELQESLRRSETMSAMGALVAGVAHEARNPLFGISATLDAFERSLKAGSSEHGRYVSVLRRELERLNQLMHELLAYGRPLSLDLSDQRLAPIAERAIEQCQGRASHQGVTLRSELTEREPAIWCDALKIEQVLRNLIENAVQHSPHGQTVVVRPLVDLKAHLAGCEVLDEGAGFNPREIRQVFEPFFSRRKGGTGLGLSIVQRVVEQHGGRVAASNRPGGGASVTVLVPIATERS